MAKILDSTNIYVDSRGWFNREYIIREVVIVHNFKWPKQLLGSCVMFYNGVIITKKEFDRVKKEVK